MYYFLLFLLAAFIILKAVGIITWSWWLVFIPAYVLVGLVVIGVVCAIVLTIVKILHKDK